MPLLDHFHPPLHPSRRWQSFHAVWSSTIVEQLNQDLLPQGYFAETQVSIGGRVEVDVATLEQSRHNGPAAATAESSGGVVTKVWAPPAPSGVMPAVFPDEIEVQVFSTSGGTTLVSAIELVSPANKDRPETRRAFTAKCASYLQAAVGLMIVDVVTERQFNLHDELIRLLEQRAEYLFSDRTPLYATAYRPARRKEGDQIEFWLKTLAVNKSLPVLPLALREGPTLPLDLECTYNEARRRSRL